jgi:translocation and assembly module TamB
MKRIFAIAGWTLFGLLMLLIAAAGVLVVLMTGQTGRDLIQNTLDGREVAGIEIRIGRLSGNPLDRLTVGRLSLADEDGVWLEAEELVIDWRPRDLLARTVTLDELSARRIAVERAPILPEREETEDEPAGELPVDIRVALLRVNAIELGEALAGERAVLSAQGRLGAMDGVWRAELDAERLDAPGDRISVQAEIGDLISVTAELDAAAGGPIANLLQAPEAEIEARVRASGTVDSGEGRAVLVIDGGASLAADVVWADRMLRAEGEADSAAWAAFEQIADILGGPARFDIALPYGEDGITDPDLNALEGAVRSPNLDVSATRAGDQSLDVHVREAANLVSYFAGEELSVRSLSAQGRLAFGEDTIGFEGVVAANGLDVYGQAFFEAVNGPVTVSGRTASPEIVTELATRGARFEAEQAGQLLGDSPALTAWLSWNNDDQRLEIAEAAVTGAENARVQASGVVDVAGERFDIDLDASALPIGRFTGQTGGRAAIRGEVTGGFDGSAAFNGVALVRGLSGEIGQRLGPDVDARIDGGLTADGTMALRELNVRSQTLLLEATGDGQGEDWTIAGDLAWSGGAPVAAVVLEGTATVAFEARSQGGSLQARLEAAADTLGAGPVLVNDPRIRFEGGGPLEAFEGRWQVVGGTERGPVDLGGQVARRGETVAVQNVDGRFGGLALDGGLEAGPNRIEAAFAARPVTGFGSADVTLLMADGRIDGRVEAQDLVADDLQYLDSLIVEVSGPVEEIAFRMAAEGAYGAAARMRAEGVVMTGEEGGSVRAELDGRYGATRIGTARTILVGFGGDDGLTATGALSLNEGSLGWDVAMGEGGSRIQADLEDVPMALVSSSRGTEPLFGDISGRVDLVQADQAWTGRVDLVADRITPAERAEDPGNIVFLDAELAVVFDEAGMRLELAARGADLTADAELGVLSGPVSDFGQLGESANSITGRASVRGEITGLAAFGLSEAQTLSGDALIEAVIAGTVGRPDLDGTARLAGGRFTDQSLGLRLRDIELLARFAEDGLEIDTLTASDGEGGRLTGQGRISFADASLTGEARIEFTDMILISRPDVTAEAGGHADIAIGEEIVVSGETRLNRVEAGIPDGGGERPIPVINVQQVNVPGGVRDDAPRPSGPPVRLDYRVVAPARVFVRADQFDTEWGLDLAITGPADDLDIRGDVRLQRGRADLLGRAFDLERGLIQLAGDPMDARLDIVAVRQAREITAQVRVGGTVRSPEITLASSPALPQDEVAARLLFDQGAGSLTGLQAAQLAAAIASLRGGGGFDPLGAMRNITGLDQLAVGSDAAGQTVVTGGRYLTDDVYLEVESGGAAASTTRIEWHLTRNLTLLSRLTGGGEAGVALTWRREYD